MLPPVWVYLCEGLKGQCEASQGLCKGSGLELACTAQMFI